MELIYLSENTFPLLPHELVTCCWDSAYLLTAGTVIVVITYLVVIPLY